MDCDAGTAMEPVHDAGGGAARRGEPGKAFVEYALLVAITAATAMLASGAVGSHLHDLFAVAANAL